MTISFYNLLMRKFYFLLLTLLITSCKENGNVKTAKSIPVDKDTSTGIQTMQQNDTANWIENFREFRNAVYQKDKIKAKQFIDFPIMNVNNEIWSLVYEGNTKEFYTIPDSIKPFTEQDFDKYFNKLFSKRFINTILKIKSEDLLRIGNAETKDFEEGNTTYKMYATFNKAKRTLSLNLSSNTITKDETGEIQDGGEFSIGYQFDILKNGQLKLKQVRLAG